MGGKSRLRSEIIKRFPDHRTYVELCGGALWVLLGKEPSKVEIANDIDDKVVNFFRVIQVCPEEFAARLQYHLVSRSLFRYYQQKLKEPGLENIEKAIAFYYLNKASFGGKGQHFGISKVQPPALNFKTLKTRINEVHDRIVQVLMESRDCFDVIDTYDSPGTFFYCDPPYETSTSRVYFQVWTPQDYKRLAETAAAIKGKILISINDSPFIRQLFSNFVIEEVAITYCVGPNDKKAQELLIRNY